MTKIEKHEEGMFSWADLATRDTEAAKAFYAELFGWTYEDQPAGPGMTYSMCKLEGGSAAAIFAQGEQEKTQGAPPHWNCYTTVKDVDALTKRAGELGGKVIVEPMDVMSAGRMVVLAGPTGAAMAYWQPKDHIGAEVIQTHGTIAWAELLTRDPAASKRFHVELMGYETEEMQTPTGVYTVLKKQGQPAVGLMEMPKEVPANVPSYWTVYFHVSDCDAALEKAKRLGASALTPIMHVPGVGRFTALTDPQGAVFEVIQAET